MNFHLQSHEICLITIFVSFLFVIILNTLTFVSFVLLGTHIFMENSSTELQLLLHLSKLIMHKYYLRSKGFKIIKVGLAVDGSLFIYIHLVAKDPIKLNNPTNT